MSTEGLTPPGGSKYSSGSMYVGDGTWDSERNTFLLPNLMGLNFDTMRYNGMRNRFKGLAGYEGLVVGHGVVAAITFLAIVPAAILIARFYHRNPCFALRMHIGLQILTVLLATVTSVLGWFAVGPQRSLTNPHHGIGLALYVLVLVQAVGGALIHHREKGRLRFKVSLNLMVHQWLGRAVAVLGFVQIPLGLTLWGSHEALFVSYAIYGLGLFLLYFYLTYKKLPVGAFDLDETVIPVGRPGSDNNQHYWNPRRGVGALTAAGAVGAGRAAWHQTSRSRRGSRVNEEQAVRSSRSSTPYRPPESRHSSGALHPGQSDSNEIWHYSHSGRDRVTESSVALRLFTAMGRLFQRTNGRENRIADGYAQPPEEMASVAPMDMIRAEEGRAPVSVNVSDRFRRAQESEIAEDVASSGLRSCGSVDSWDNVEHTNHTRDGTHGNNHGLTSGIIDLEIFRFIKDKLHRNIIKGKGRLQLQQTEYGRMAQRNSQRRGFTGKDLRLREPTKRHLHDIREGNLPSPLHSDGQPFVWQNIGSRINISGGESHHDTGPRLLAHDPSSATATRMHTGSDYRLHAQSNQNSRHPCSKPDAALAGTGATLAREAQSCQRRSRDQSGDPPGAFRNPVSVRVKVRKGGQQVTLHRLPEREAIGHRRDGPRRMGSLDSVRGSERWRRAEVNEAQEVAEIQRERCGPSDTNPTGSAVNAILATRQRYPEPPRSLPGLSIHESSSQPATSLPPAMIGTMSGIGSGLVSGGSPFSPSGTEPSNYQNNRHRRRAERFVGGGKSEAM